MNSEEELFEAATALPEAERAAYLEKACADQPEQRARLEALLRSHDTVDFMEAATVT